MLWCTHDLAAFGFQPKVCEWQCDSWLSRVDGTRYHVVGVQDASIDQRIAVPAPLVIAVFRAIAKLLAAIQIPAGEPATRKRPRRELQFIWGGRRTAAGDEVRVQWKGVDAAQWVDVTALSDLREFPFVHNDVRRECLALFELI